MLCRSFLRRCGVAAATTTTTPTSSSSSSSSTPGSLTAWVAQLAAEAESLRDAASSSSSSSCATTTLDERLRKTWSGILGASAHAAAMKESDALFSVARLLILAGLAPPRDVAGAIWPPLVERLLSSSDVEQHAVLKYPGTSDAANRRAAAEKDVGRRDCDVGSSSSSSSHGAKREVYVPPTREVLLVSGGIIPLSSRRAEADGEALALMMYDFVSSIGEMAGTSNAQNGAWIDGVDATALLQHVSEALVKVLATNAASLRFTHVEGALIAFLQLLQVHDEHHHAQQQQQQQRASSGEDEKLKTPTQPLLPTCATAMMKALDAPSNGLGARVVLRFLNVSHAHQRCASRWGPHGAAATRALDVSTPRPSAELSPDAKWHRHQTFLELLQRTCEHLPRHYTIAALGGDGAVRHVLQSLMVHLDVVLQHNANDANPLKFEQTALDALHVVVYTALLRAMRLELHGPEAFIRAAMSVMDRCPNSMAIEAELLDGKAALLDLPDLSAEARSDIYDDLVATLRNMVDLRPRSGVVAEEDDEGEDGFTIHNNTDTEEMHDALGQQTDHNNTESHGLLQAAHARVVAALCASHDIQRINAAYQLLLSHKYHGLIITTDTIHPVMAALSRRGDCRVFNLVDLCVLYSGSHIDMKTMEYLFAACAVAGDHYRAATLLRMLSDVIPGFLLKASPSLLDSLRQLKIIKPEPPHLFLSEEEKLIRQSLQHTGVEL